MMDSKVLTLMLMAARADCFTKLSPLSPPPQLPLPSSFSLLCEGTIERFICRNLMLAWQEAIYTALALFTKVWHSRTRCPRDTPYKASQNIALGSWKWRYFLKYLVWPSDTARRPKTVFSERHVELVFLRELELAMVANNSLSFYRVCIPH